MFNIANYWLELGGLASNGFFSRNNYFQIGSKTLNQDYGNFRKKYKNTDIYQCRYFYESKDIDNCLLYGGFYLDLDGDINTDNGYEDLKMDVSGVVSFFKSIGLTDDEILIYCSHERYESDGILVYNDVLFDVSGDVMPEILQRTNLSKTIPIASHVTNLDDYYVWRYQYNSEDGFQKLYSPFD